MALIMPPHKHSQLALIIVVALFVLNEVGRSFEYFNLASTISDKFAAGGKIPSRVFLKTHAHRCNSTKDAPFLSQGGEDRYLLANFFSNLCGGTYIEMGALDGKLFSNSFYFNQALGWKGLLIEASPENFKALELNRQDELVPPINAAVCGEEKDVHWISKGAVGGIVEFAPTTFQQRWWNENMISSAAVIKCMPLNQIIHRAGIGSKDGVFFDFFSLDVEGAEYDVLQTVDFDEISFGVIFYESDEHNPLKNMAVQMLLESKGYKFLARYERSNWHVNSRFAEIYTDDIHDKQ